MSRKPYSESLELEKCNINKNGTFLEKKTKKKQPEVY